MSGMFPSCVVVVLGFRTPEDPNRPENLTESSAYLQGHCLHTPTHLRLVQDTVDHSPWHVRSAIETDTHLNGFPVVYGDAFLVLADLDFSSALAVAFKARWSTIESTLLANKTELGSCGPETGHDMKRPW